MSKKRRKPSVSAVVNASMQIAAESAEEFLRFLEHVEEFHDLNKQTPISSPALSPALVNSAVTK